LEDEMPEMEPMFPLVVNICDNCHHTQLKYTVPAELRYCKHDYSYDSSNSNVSIAHFTDLAEDIIFKYGVNKDDLICDIGSNIGTLLEAFRRIQQCEVVGIDPSSNISKLANERGIRTINEFFNDKSVADILKIKKPKVITATNVLNHSEDIDNFFKCCSRLIHEQGVVVIEVPYLHELMKKTAFDTIYLEHVNYFSIKPLASYLEVLGFGIDDIAISEYMCGTLRLFIKKNVNHSNIVKKFIDNEIVGGLFSEQTYEDFMGRVKQIKYFLNKKLFDVKSSGGKIIAIGAATKGNTLLNYCKIDSSLIEYVTDTSFLKIGKITPGSHLPIRSDNSIGPDITYGLILPWNIADHLKMKLSNLGLKYIVPMEDLK
jgi:2-polyprenyl-3-methyl-5-hydroxy-6-metoxy-1,4-benzoquinol methylase